MLASHQKIVNTEINAFLSLSIIETLTLQTKISFVYQKLVLCMLLKISLKQLIFVHFEILPYLLLKFKFFGDITVSPALKFSDTNYANKHLLIKFSV